MIRMAQPERPAGAEHIGNGVEIMKKNIFEVFVDVGLGKSEWSMLTTDISIDYVKINAEYST